MVKDLLEKIFEADESFIDFERGIFYSARGSTRSIKGLFASFKLERTPKDSELKEIIRYLIQKGKLTKADMIEYQNKKRLVELEDD